MPRIELESIDHAAIRMYYEELAAIESERRIVLLTIQVLNILENDNVIYPRETVSSLRLYFRQEIHKATTDWERRLETARAYVARMIINEFVTRQASIATLVNILQERLYDLTLQIPPTPH